MMILPLGNRVGLTPHAWAGSIERPIQSADWSIVSPSGSAEVHLSQSVPNAVCLKSMALGMARIQVTVTADGKQLTGFVDVQVVAVG